jgi:hypothetical protein
VIWIAVALSLLHLLNFVNYTTLAGQFNPPLTRSVLLVFTAFIVLLYGTRNLSLHITRAWDMYAICAIALVSAAWSDVPLLTLQYSGWLLLAVYVGTELSLRIRSPADVVFALSMVIIPAAFLVALVNLTMGPVVVHTGRHFGALGSRHIDSAYAMNFICLCFALWAMPVRTFSAPATLKVAMLATLVWSFYQAVVGLTRSVWLGVAMTLALYAFRARLNLRTIGLAMFGVFLVAVVLSFVDFGGAMSDAVKGRLEITEERYESGSVDPRIEVMLMAFKTIWRNPQGIGYAVGNSHNSYVNILLQIGWPGFIFALIAMLRSAFMVRRMGFGWLMFFAIGSSALLLHAFFEVQNFPGQANFVPLLAWYAVSRARFLPRESLKIRQPLARFVEP